MLCEAITACLSVSPDGRSVATGIPDTNILIWDLAPATRRQRVLTAADLDRLWDELAGTENRLAVARQRYNEAVQQYNTSRRQFPANLTAKMFRKEWPTCCAK